MKLILLLTLPFLSICALLGIAFICVLLANEIFYGAVRAWGEYWF